MSNFYSWLMSTNDSAVALDELNFTFDEDDKVYRKHPDGSPCHAKDPKDCPILGKNEKAEENDNLGKGKEEKTGGGIGKTPFMQSLEEIRPKLVDLYTRGTEVKNQERDIITKIINKHGSEIDIKDLKRMMHIMQYNPKNGKVIPHANDQEAHYYTGIFKKLPNNTQYGILNVKKALGRINEKMNSCVAEAKAKTPWTKENGFNADIYGMFIDSIKQEVLDKSNDTRQ